MKPAAPAIVVLIPGIGGHPAFHAHLLEALARGGQVHTQAHGDFSTEPLATLQAHVGHWLDFINRITTGPILLIGISFGSQIAAGLSERLGERLRALLLISWWPIGPLERGALSLLKRLPEKPVSHLLGRFMFFWSERSSEDPAALRRQRSALYDDEHSVHRRLRMRLLCCRDARLPAAALRCDQRHLLYGTREMALARFRWASPGTRRLGVLHEVNGSHSMSTRASSEFELAVTALIERLQPPHRDDT